MQIQTERGLISIDASYRSEERCEMDGYKYAFTAYNVFNPLTDETINSVDIFSKCLDDRGLRHTFAWIEK